MSFFGYDYNNLGGKYVEPVFELADGTVIQLPEASGGVQLPTIDVPPVKFGDFIAPWEYTRAAPQSNSGPVRMATNPNIVVPLFAIGIIGLAAAAFIGAAK